MRSFWVLILLLMLVVPAQAQQNPDEPLSAEEVELLSRIEDAVEQAALYESYHLDYHYRIDYGMDFEQYAVTSLITLDHTISADVTTVDGQRNVSGRQVFEDSVLATSPGADDLATTTITNAEFRLVEGTLYLLVNDETIGQVETIPDETYPEDWFLYTPDKSRTLDNMDFDYWLPETFNTMLTATNFDLQPEHVLSVTSSSASDLETITVTLLSAAIKDFMYNVDPEANTEDETLLVYLESADPETLTFEIIYTLNTEDELQSIDGEIILPPLALTLDDPELPNVTEWTIYIKLSLDLDFSQINEAIEPVSAP